MLTYIKFSQTIVKFIILQFNDNELYRKNTHTFISLKKVIYIKKLQITAFLNDFKQLGLIKTIVFLFTFM